MNPHLLLPQLSGCRAFSELSPAELARLADAGEFRSLAKGDAVRGERRELYAVLSGGIVVVRGAADDGTPWTSRLGAGAVFNELAFLGGDEVFEAARCVEDATLFALPATHFEELVAEGCASAAKIGTALARSVAGRLRERNGALLKLMRQHEALLDSMDRLLTDPQVQEELFGRASTGPREFSTFRDELLANWDY